MNELDNPNVELLPERGDYIGYLEYSGQGVADGLLDARKSARALVGLDGALRFFLGREDPSLRDLDFEIPIRMRCGSWQALIPQSIGNWITTALGAAVTMYMVTAASQMAKHDFSEVGIRDVVRRSLSGLLWVMRLAKHLGTMGNAKFTGLKWRENNQEAGVSNEGGKYLFVPNHILDLFADCPPSLFADMASVIARDRILKVTVIEQPTSSEVSVSEEEKPIFYVPDEEQEILFPELVHGQHVEFEGLVTRGNENTNSIGFRYKGHILTCLPGTGSIVRFKPALFLVARITGTITRVDKLGKLGARRPKIIVDDVIPIEKGTRQATLFDSLPQEPSQPSG